MAAEDLIEFDGGVLVADLLQEATITDTSELTQYAVEDGSLISDHAIRQPRTLSLTLVQTETPISETSGFARALQALTYQARTPGQQTTTVPVRQSEFRPAPLMALSSGIQSMLFGGGPTKEIKVTGVKSDTALASKDLKVHVLSAGAPVARVNEFHANLLSLLETATPVFVHVKGATYIDLVVTSVTRTDAGGQAGKASFRVELRQISTVETKTVDLPPVPKAKGAKQIGAKSAAETNAEQKAKLTSQLIQLGQAGGLVE
jgi:hypothetical protein